MMRCQVVLCIYLLAAVAAVSAICQSGWVGDCNTCYKFVTKPLDWASADVACRGLDGQLAAIDNLQRSAFITGYLNLHTDLIKKFWWTGGKLVDGKWAWPSPPSDPALFSYTNWGLTEPNNGGAAQCLSLHPTHSGGWNDDYCQNKYNYICEREATDSEVFG